MSYQLVLFYDDKVIAHLEYDGKTGLLRLQYEQDWQQQGFSISPALGLNEPHAHNSAYNFLDNLLPEGEARKLLAQNLGVSETYVFAQIRALGQDLSGAITFLGTDKVQDSQPIFRAINEQELIQRLEQKEDFGLLIWDDKPRLSVAGVQDKINVIYTENGEIGFGDGSLCSTHILKFERHNCPHLVLNEFFCMSLAKIVGLPVASVTFKRFGDFPALQVERFDRKLDSSQQKVFKRHLIDACQALDLPRDYKYEQNLGDGRDVAHIRDGASLEKLFNFCRNTPTPAINIQWLLNWQLFNLMINNYDSHAKNLSFFYGNDLCQFSPSYDLVNVAMYPQFKQTLAMAIGEEFDPNSIFSYQLADFAEICSIDKKLLSRTLKTLARKVLKAIDEMTIEALFDDKTILTPADKDYWQELKENIVLRTTHLVEQAEEIPNIIV